MNTIAFMAVPRSLPACFAATGWTLGIGCLLYSSVVTYDTGILLGQICTGVHHSESSFPALGARAAAAFAARHGWSTASQGRWERAGRVAVATLQYSCYYLTGVAELIYMEQYLGQLFEFSPLCQWQWLLIVGVVSLPVVQVPSFNDSRFLALVFGVMPLLLNVGVMMYEIWTVLPWACEPGPTYIAWPSAPRAAVGLTAFAYAFGGHGMYPEQIRELAQPSRWPEVMGWTYGFTVPLYWACGSIGYLAYGSYAQANLSMCPRVRSFPLSNSSSCGKCVSCPASLFPAFGATPCGSRASHRCLVSRSLGPHDRPQLSKQRREPPFYRSKRAAGVFLHSRLGSRGHARH